ncbi:N-acetyl-gamma-glutamyl-phosphate reductase [Lentzea chajnantorensis]
MTSISAGVVGAAGYIGGELLRLLTAHPEVEVTRAYSASQQGKRVDSLHPNLRGHTSLTFTHPDELGSHDVLFIAVSHGKAAELVQAIGPAAPLVVDLTADFRLKDPAVYETYYDSAHPAPDLLAGFTPGLPERHRDALRTAARISVPGCMANAAILALAPLAGIVDQDVTIDAKIGSSGSGATATGMNLHSERSGAMRVFAAVRHRHEAEVGQETGLRVRMTATGVEAVRGAQVLCHATASGVTENDLRRAYRTAYGNEPFVRIVAQRRGLYRLPEPKILAGTNFCDVGFAVDGDRVLAVAALDNLGKGGASNAVQCLNIRMGWAESTGLGFVGLHPI